MGGLSVEAIVAIVGVVVGLPPTVLVLVQYMKRRRYRPRSNRVPHLHPPPDHRSRRLSYVTGRPPNAEPAYGFVEEQYSLSQTVTFRRASPWRPP